MGISGFCCFHGEMWGNYQNSQQEQVTLFSIYIWVFSNTSYFTYSIEIGWNRNKNATLGGKEEGQKYFLLIREGNKNIRSKRKHDTQKTKLWCKVHPKYCIFLIRIFIRVDRTSKKREKERIIFKFMMLLGGYERKQDGRWGQRRTLTLFVMINFLY